MMKKSIVVTMLLLVMVFSLTLISQAEKTTVEVLSWWDFSDSEPLQQLKAKFEELNPDLEMEFVQIGASSYADKVLVMVAGGADLPDVMMLALDKIPVFGSKGAIMNLDSFIDEDEEFKKSVENFYPIVGNALQYNGSYYAMPRDVTSKVMYLNKKMFDEAGVDIPNDDWTWDDFAEITKQLTRDTNNDGNIDQWGFYFPKYMDGITHWLMQNGGGLISSAGESLVGTPESIEALQFLRRLIREGYIPSDTQAQQYGSSWDASFKAGKVAMLEAGLSTYANIDKYVEDYAIRPLPKGKKQLTTAFVNSWAIPRGAKNPELSWRVLKFFASKEAQEIALNTGMGLPFSSEVNVESFLDEKPDNKYFIESLEYSEPFPVHIYGVDFYKLVQEELDLMWIGDESVEKAVGDIESQADRVLSGRW